MCCLPFSQYCSLFKCQAVRKGGRSNPDLHLSLETLLSLRRSKGASNFSKKTSRVGSVLVLGFTKSPKFLLNERFPEGGVEGSLFVKNSQIIPYFLFESVPYLKVRKNCTKRLAQLKEEIILEFRFRFYI